MKTLVVFVFLSFTSFAQMSRQDSTWLPLQFLIGEWMGQGEGEPGKGNYERNYKFIFNNKFIEIRNKSVYNPSVNNLEGEMYEDIGYISYDRIRKTFILRQFHIEGFVNQYKLESISTIEGGRRISFISESIENIPEGWKARETYHLNNDNQFTEIFELAQPGKDFQIYSKAVLRKVK